MSKGIIVFNNGKAFSDREVADWYEKNYYKKNPLYRLEELQSKTCQLDEDSILTKFEECKKESFKKRLEEYFQEYPQECKKSIDEIIFKMYSRGDSK